MTMIDMARYPLIPEGPLAEWVHPFRDEMDAAGYSAQTARDNAYVMACLSRWMDRSGVMPQRLGTVELEEFVRWRGEWGYRRWLSVRSLRELLAFLRRAGVIPPEHVATSDPAGELVERFACYLRRERRLRESTIAGRVRVAEGFLRALMVEDRLRLDRLDARIVVEFVLDNRGRYASNTMKFLTVGLRSLLRYLFADGIVDQDHSAAVPAVAGWRLATLPPTGGEEMLAALLGACDRSTVLGLRDYAVMLLMARLGLRAAEIAGLRLEDLDWRRGELVVHGKGGRVDRLPLPADVGRAIADYLRRGRRPTALRALFLRTIGPDEPMARQSVVMVPRCAAQRAGIPEVGAHRLRHLAACRVLAGGGNLGEVAQLLRHEGQDTAAIYAKVDLAALSAAVRPWPGTEVSGR